MKEMREMRGKKREMEEKMREKRGKELRCWGDGIVYIEFGWK